MVEAPKISVLVCTYNRCQNLGGAIESIAAQSLPPSLQWEIVVVDNNSSDQTRQVVEDFGRRCPGHFRYLFEPRQGKSHALNTGIKEARGDIIAFIDDDVTVEPMWRRSAQTGRCGCTPTAVATPRPTALPPRSAPDGSSSAISRSPM